MQVSWFMTLEKLSPRIKRKKILKKINKKRRCGRILINGRPITICYSLYAFTLCYTDYTYVCICLSWKLFILSYTHITLPNPGDYTYGPSAKRWKQCIFASLRSIKFSKKHNVCSCMSKAYCRWFFIFFLSMNFFYNCYWSYFILVSSIVKFKSALLSFAFSLWWCSSRWFPDLCYVFTLWSLSTRLWICWTHIECKWSQCGYNFGIEQALLPSFPWAWAVTWVLIFLILHQGTTCRTIKKRKEKAQLLSLLFLFFICPLFAVCCLNSTPLIILKHAG